MSAVNKFISSQIARALVALARFVSSEKIKEIETDALISALNFARG